MTNDEQLYRAFEQEIQRLSHQGVGIHLILKPEQAMALIDAIQLACRQPEYTGSSRLIVTRIVDRMQSEFLEYRVPAILEVIRLGWEPEQGK